EWIGSPPSLDGERPASNFDRSSAAEAEQIVVAAVGRRGAALDRVAERGLAGLAQRPRTDQVDDLIEVAAETTEALVCTAGRVERGPGRDRERALGHVEGDQLDPEGRVELLGLSHAVLDGRGLADAGRARELEHRGAAGI